MSVFYNRSSDICSILAIGDSWFWYPRGSNLLAEIAQVVKTDYANIRALGYLGAELRDYVQLHETMPAGKYAAGLDHELQPGFLQYYSAVMISGGGNDVVDWHLFLNEDCSAATNAVDCIDQASLRQHMRDLQVWVLLLLDKIKAAYDRAGLLQPFVFTHTYDYAPPNGKGFTTLLAELPLVPPWLKPAMDRCQVPNDYELRKAVVREFINALAAMYARTAMGRLLVVQSQGTLDVDKDWDNELHPTAAGFKKLVQQKWVPQLQAAGLAT